MFDNLSEEQLRAICRTNLEALEKWARLLLHYILSADLGPDYFHKKNPDGNFMFKKSLVEKSDEMMENEPGRFPTPLDTLFLDELIYLLHHPDVYPLISMSFENIYPEGKEEMKSFLAKLIPIRNKLSHTNPFSYRDAQMAVCYSNDFIDGVKNYFEQNKMAKEFNVPTIIKVTDSFGNELLPSPEKDTIVYDILNPKDKTPITLYQGDKFSVALEIDPSFSSADYHLDWSKIDGVEILDDGRKVNITIGNKLIGKVKQIFCRLVYHNDWHRCDGYDQLFTIKFKAVPLPPSNP